MADLTLNSEVNIAVRDFDGLTQAFQEYAQANFSDIWTDFNDGSFANAISEIVAYLGDNLHFYIDRQTQDSFLATTQDRQAAIDLAALIGYRPFTARPATGQVTFTLDNAVFDYLTALPRGFKVSNGSDIIFETASNTLVPNGATSVTVDVIEGETIRETSSGLGPLAVADGSPFQSYVLSRKNVILSRNIEDINTNEDLFVTVNGDQYTATETLSTALSSDKVFTIEVNDENETIITFGNGEFGTIPADGLEIEVIYRVLVDSDTRSEQNNGNVSAGGVTSLVGQRAGVSSVTNAASMTGGGPRESLSEIKINAPASLTALNRAVSLNDFAILAKDVTGVAKSVATAAQSDLDVIVYVAPNGGGLPSSLLKSQVVDSFDGKKMAKTTVFARDPVYQNVLVNLKVFVQSTFSASEVKENIRLAISNLFNFENMDFGRQVLLKSTSTTGDIYDLNEALENVEGIDRLEIKTFTLKPVVFDKITTNSGTVSASQRPPKIRANSRRAEYEIDMNTSDQFILRKSIVGTSTTLNDTTITDDRLDLSLESGTSTDTGLTFLQDSEKSFQTNEFAGQSLVDSSGVVFRIVSNTSDTITVSSGTPSAGNYQVVERFVGAILQPTSVKEDEFRIVSNTANSFTVAAGLGTVSSAGDEYRVKVTQTNEFDTTSTVGREDPVTGTISSTSIIASTISSLTDNALAGVYGANTNSSIFNGYQLVMTNGDASNDVATVISFNEVTGTFSLDTPGTIDASASPGDSYVCAPKFQMGRISTVDDSSFSPTTTEFDLPDLTGKLDDYYVGYKVKFLSGTHEGLIRAVNGYDTATGRFTIDELPSPPSDGDSVEVSKDFEDNERSITFALVADQDVVSSDKFFFNASELAGDLIPGVTQILQVNAEESAGDVIITTVGGKSVVANLLDITRIPQYDLEWFQQIETIWDELEEAANENCSRIERLDSEATILKADYLDPVSTVLPTGASVTLDGEAGQDGDIVLFTSLASGNNKRYQLSGVGSSLVWTPLDGFGNGDSPSEDPQEGDKVIILSGDFFQNQVASFSDSEWKVNENIRFFNGTDFWELSNIQTTDILNDSSANVFSVAYEGSENIIVNYSIIRGGSHETGILLISTDGSTISLGEAFSSPTSTGVEFDAALNGTDLELNYTSDDSGSSGTLKYYISRWSNASGGPAGVPSYTGSGGSIVDAAGTPGDIQFNSGGSLAADANFKWDSVKGVLNLNGLEIVPLSQVVIGDNQTEALLFSYAAADYKNSEIKYSIDRNGQTQMGTLTVTQNGTSISISNEFNQTSSAVGVTFSAEISGGNVNILYDSTSIGSSGTFKYSIFRWL